MASRFTHLHCHTQYSLLDGAAKIKELIAHNQVLGMDALAITDHGNMYGVPHFVNAAHRAGVKPIVGCEFYIADDMHARERGNYHQLLLAKDARGYRNLMRLCSLGFTEGYYYKPRVDRATIAKHAEGLIATSCCLGAEIPQAILHKGEAEGERLLKEWMAIFGEDYYIEVQRHGLPEQDKCNAVLLRWAKQYNVKVIATNDVHYIRKEDSEAHDILLCMQTGKDYDDPKRMRFHSDAFYLKSPQEMASLFADVPEALDNTDAIVDKVERLDLEREVLMPTFPLPEGFATQGAYLAHLTYAGARRRYGAVSEAVEGRLRYELGVLQEMGFAGYFLIVQDFIAAARTLDVAIGPGRGSAAGSLVAYCLGITDIDPIKWDLLFERFLNPARISRPDIDIDFDDEGRQKVIDYVVEKYGKDRVAQIVTFGTMGAKSAIKDVARVLRMPLDRANHLAKLVPERLGMTLGRAFKEEPALAKLRDGEDALAKRVLAMATTLEGSTRHTSIHAAGIIITPNKITDYVPVKTDKRSDLLVTQYDGSLVESLGLLKMDFLGLKTLTILKEVCRLVQANHDKAIDLPSLPLDDAKTFALYQAGHTIATFQFESEGMRQWLPKLKPTHMEDLIAMNSLYRPGPMQFIPNFIARKHGKEPITYPHKALEALLAPTYGIMVYQEQIMKAARIMAGYTLGQADLLRRAMGKKKADEMAKQKAIFIKGAQATQGITVEEATTIFEMMEKFAQYGFNRSHAAAYSLVAYQTAYMKAHYPAEYMAAVLTHNQQDQGKLTFFLEETGRMDIKVLGPDVNHSDLFFTSQGEGIIRFGLGAIKGMGTAAAAAIVTERQAQGPYKDIYDFSERLTTHKIQRSMRESMAMVGAFDTWDYHRKQYTHPLAPGKGNLLEQTLKQAQHTHAQRTNLQQSLFAAEPSAPYHAQRTPPACTPYTEQETLKIERELLGFYMSGHPLDAHKLTMQRFCNSDTACAMTQHNQEVRLAGVLLTTEHRTQKNGQPFARFTLEDLKGTLELALFGEDYRKYQHLLHEGEMVYLTGKVQERYGRQGSWALRIQHMTLLSEVAGKQAKALQLLLSVAAVDAHAIQHLRQAITDHPGPHTLEVILTATLQGHPTEDRTRATKHKVALDEALLQRLATLPGLQYKLI